MSGNKYLIFGTGGMAKRQLEFLEMLNDKTISIVAFVDNSKDKWGEKFEGYPVVAPYQIANMSFDYISIWSTYYEEIRKQLIDELHISEDKIKSIFDDFINLCEERQLCQCKNDNEISESEFFFRVKKAAFAALYEI